MNAQQITLKDRLIKRATEEYAKWPQFEGYFKNWELVRLRRGIKFPNSGAWFRAGDYTIALRSMVDIDGEPSYQILTQFPANSEMKDLLTTGLAPIPARGNFLEFMG